MKRLSDLFIGAFPFNSVTFAFALLLLPAHMVHSDEAKNTDRLNVLYIVSDDLNNNLGCYGHGVVQSPNIDRLAARAMRFDHAYCDYPVCNPSRVSFLSGLRTPSTEIVDLATPTRTHLKDAIFLPKLFRKNGYRTIKVGKIFHTGDQHEPRERGDSKFGDLHTLGRTVFDGRWRYTQWHDNSVERYDHQSDPLEYKNLAGDSGYTEQLTTMKQRLRDGWKAALPLPTK